MIFANAIGKMTARSINPEPNRFPADNNTALCQKVRNISGTHRKTMAGPDRISYDLTRLTVALQAGKRTLNFHSDQITQVQVSDNLAANK